MRNLNTVNSVIMLSVDNVYPTAQQLQGYSADDVFDLEDIDVAETSMGIDGLLSGGLIYVPIMWTINLQANSPSCAIFDAWYNYQKSQGDLSNCHLNITLPGLGYKWAYSNGFLKKYSPAPSAKKILQPRKFQIEFNGIGAQPV
jgi:hypothetical protein